MPASSSGAMSLDRRGDADSTGRYILNSLNASTRTLGAQSHSASALGATSNQLRAKKMQKLRQESDERQFKSEVAKELQSEIMQGRIGKFKQSILDKNLRILELEDRKKAERELLRVKNKRKQERAQKRMEEAAEDKKGKERELEAALEKARMKTEQRLQQKLEEVSDRQIQKAQRMLQNQSNLDELRRQKMAVQLQNLKNTVIRQENAQRKKEQKVILFEANKSMNEEFKRKKRMIMAQMERMRKENRNIEDIFNQQFMDDIIIEENSEDVESEATERKLYGPERTLVDQGTEPGVPATNLGSLEDEGERSYASAYAGVGQQRALAEEAEEDADKLTDGLAYSFSQPSQMAAASRKQTGRWSNLKKGPTPPNITVDSSHHEDADAAPRRSSPQRVQVRPSPGVSSLADSANFDMYMKDNGEEPQTLAATLPDAHREKGSPNTTGFTTQHRFGDLKIQDAHAKPSRAMGIEGNEEEQIQKLKEENSRLMLENQGHEIRRLKEENERLKTSAATGNGDRAGDHLRSPEQNRWKQK